MALCSSFMVYAAYLLCLIGQVSADGLLCCTISDDKAVKIYDVINYDMMAMLKLTFHPKAVEWVFKQGDARAKLAISDKASPYVHMFDARSGSNEPIISKHIHMGPMQVMKYSPALDIVVSADAKALLEYWSPDTLEFPTHGYSSSLLFLTVFISVVSVF
jgi:peptidylprolyl isomerase domain and WD repeat-containing protein 1